MRRGLVVLALVLAQWSAGTVHAAEARAVQVLVSFSILADVTREVGGDLVAVRAIVGPDRDAHVYQSRPSDLAAFSRMDLVVTHGLGFDPWMGRMIEVTQFAGPVVVASAGVVPLRVGNAVDPHAWQDPRNVMMYARNIAAALIALRPDATQAIHARSERYIATLSALHAQFESTLGSLPAEHRRFVTSHDAFGYLAHAYGLEVIAPQGWSTQSQASARTVAIIIDQLRTHQVRAVFLENMVDRRLVDRIAREGGVVMGSRLYSDALAASGSPADTYVGMMRHNLAQLGEALSK
jgi:zinc/manganese transport system substrate-binding protein